MMGLGNIFKIAEWNIGTQENLIAFEQKLLAIFKAVEDLRLSLGEKVTSIDLEVSVVGPRFRFDHRWMEDGYGDAQQEICRDRGWNDWDRPKEGCSLVVWGHKVQ